MLNAKTLNTSHFKVSISLTIFHLCMPMTYQLWHWQYEWYIRRGWWFVDCDEDFRNIHKYTNLSWTCLVSGPLNFEHPSVLLFCLVFALYNFDLVPSLLKINAAWLLFIMLICAKIVEIQYIILFRTTSMRIRCKQGLIPMLRENNPF